MDERIKKELEQEEPTEFHRALLKHCKQLIDSSRKKMVQFYDTWDHNDEIYRGFMQPDKQDSMARDRGEPQKMVIPVTYTQIQTFVAFCTSLYLQRERLFELVGRSEDDHKAAKVGEAIIARDLTWNTFESILSQFLLDIARFGIGIIKTSWIRRVKEVDKAMPLEGMTLFGMQITKPTTVVERVSEVSYLGNKIMNISPYNFFPDVRLPIARFQEGEYCGSETVYTTVELRKMEAEGEVAGIDWLKPFSMADYQARGNNTRLSGILPQDPEDSALKVPASSGMCVLTEVQVELIPSSFMIDDKPLGKSNKPEKWVVWYVNDKRIVKAEPLGYDHNLFTYDIAEYSPDGHKLINDGLATTIDQLQNVCTWMINSRITSVRKTVQNMLVVDPSGVEMKDLVDRKPVIRLRPDRAGQGVDKFVRQLDIRDVTGSHVEDANNIKAMVQEVTGINDNAMGQYHTGRRSAMEARNVNSSAAARLKLPALLIFRTALEPMARKMISNHQQGLDEPQYIAVMGTSADPQDFTRFKQVTREDLIGSYEFEVFDGTLPSERYAQASAIQNFLTEFSANPEVIMMLGFDPRKLVTEWLELSGIRNPKRFEMDALRQQELQQQYLVSQQLKAVGNGKQLGLPGGQPEQAAAPAGQNVGQAPAI